MKKHMWNMLKEYWFMLVLVAFVFGMMAIGLMNAGKAQATAIEKIYWCHVEPNENSQTLHLPPSALQEAGHMDADGNPLHAGDHAGACEEPEGTPSPTLTPTPTPECEEGCDVTPTATPSATPSPTPSVNTGGPGDGLSDGRSDGRSSCPECTAPPKAQPDEMTFAATGEFPNRVMESLVFVGSFAMGIGLVLLKRG